MIDKGVGLENKGEGKGRGIRGGDVGRNREKQRRDWRVGVVARRPPPPLLCHVTVLAPPFTAGYRERPSSPIFKTFGYTYAHLRRTFQQVERHRLLEEAVGKTRASPPTGCRTSHRLCSDDLYVFVV